MKTVRKDIEVRYQETDQMGVVYHANYLVWFELGRTEFTKMLGLDYNGMEKYGVVAPVLDAQIKFIKPIRYGEKTYINTWLESYKGVRTVYGYEIYNENEEVAVSGTTTHAVVDKETFRPISIKRKFPDWHAAYMNMLEEA